MLPEERRYANKLIAQYASGRFGVSADYLNNSDAVEIKIGQVQVRMEATSWVRKSLLSLQNTDDTRRYRRPKPGPAHGYCGTGRSEYEDQPAQGDNRLESSYNG
jgi:hypothetical protein